MEHVTKHALSDTRVGDTDVHIAHEMRWLRDDTPTPDDAPPSSRTRARLARRQVGCASIDASGDLTVTLIDLVSIA